MDGTGALWRPGKGAAPVQLFFNGVTTKYGADHVAVRVDSGDLDFLKSFAIRAGRAEDARFAIGESLADLGIERSSMEIHSRKMWPLPAAGLVFAQASTSQVLVTTARRFLSITMTIRPVCAATGVDSAPVRSSVLHGDPPRECVGALRGRGRAAPKLARAMEISNV